MAGATKRRIRRLRESGNDSLADWLVEKEVARAEGLSLAAWEKEHKKPPEKNEDGNDIETDTDFDKTVHKINHFRDSDHLRINAVIPRNIELILDKIKDSKKLLKEKAMSAAKRHADAELKTIFKVLKRLDSEEKKIIYEYDFQAFDRDFFDDLQDRVPTAQFHFEMVSLYNSASRSCVVCPRGHAKSTMARKYILHQILYKKATYVIIGGSSEDMAAQNLRWIRDQICDNKKILEVFGYLKNKDKWADTEFQTNNGIKVTAKGAGQKIRGANEKGRPDLIYLDDLEEDEQVSSADRRYKLRRWFTNALLPAKSKKGRVIITGTILHMDSLLKNISENKVKDHIPWQVLWYQAIWKDDDGDEHALWEAHKPLEELQKLREVDPQTFAQEYQNNPVSGAMAVFNRDEYKYVSDKDVRVDEKTGVVYVRGGKVNVLLTTDMAVSEKEGADYTVFMITGMDQHSNLYVLEYERFRTSDPYEQIELIFKMAARWGADTATMETVAFNMTFKRLLERDIEKRGIMLYIHELTRQNIRKIFRIKALKGPIKAGRVFWQQCHTELEDELDQVTATGLGTHDDVIDALADAWDVQMEMIDEREPPKADVNTVQWLIDEGQFPTVEEAEEMALYG